MRKRKKGEDDGGDVTYINDANKVFNRKINRYFDKYTQESVSVPPRLVESFAFVAFATWLTIALLLAVQLC
jgi:hypothetical protein